MTPSFGRALNRRRRIGVSMNRPQFFNFHMWVAHQPGSYGPSEGEVTAQLLSRNFDSLRGHLYTAKKPTRASRLILRKNVHTIGHAEG
jgi:hypothetical protein